MGVYKTQRKQVSPDLISEFLESLTAGDNLTNGPSTQIPNCALLWLLKDSARMDWIERNRIAERAHIDRMLSAEQNNHKPHATDTSEAA